MDHNDKATQRAAAFQRVRDARAHATYATAQAQKAAHEVQALRNHLNALLAVMRDDDPHAWTAIKQGIASGRRQRDARA